MLARGAVIRGGINISGAQLAADLDCAGADFTAGPKASRSMPAKARCGGTALLRSTRVEGEVRLTASEIAGDLDCSGAALDNSGGMALDMSRAIDRGARSSCARRPG